MRGISLPIKRAANLNACAAKAFVFYFEISLLKFFSTANSFATKQSKNSQHAAGVPGQRRGARTRTGEAVSKNASIWIRKIEAKTASNCLQLTFSCWL